MDLFLLVEKGTAPEYKLRLNPLAYYLVLSWDAYTKKIARLLGLTGPT